MSAVSLLGQPGPLHPRDDTVKNPVLVLTALQAPGSGGPRGIAWVDIADYL